LFNKLLISENCILRFPIALLMAHYEMLFCLLCFYHYIVNKDYH